MAKCLVAGAAGFLGSNLSKYLLYQGHDVIGIDDLSTGYTRNLEVVREHNNFDFICLSVTDSKLEEIYGEIDLIFHLASPASPPKYQSLGIKTIHANSVGTENLIQLALRKNSRLVFASTSEVYGDPTISPQPESYWGNVNPIGVRSVYDESKRLGETLVAHYVRESGLNGGIVRIFNTYGPGMDPYDGRVVSTFIRQALSGESFTVFGSGEQTRSFCFVDDLIEGLTKFGFSSHVGPINLGNPNEMSLLDLGTIISKELNVEPVFEFHPLPEDDPVQRCPDISRAKELLNWEPTIELAIGIRETANWIKTELESRGEL